MVVLQNFIDRLNQYLREKELTNKEFAEKIGFSPAFVSQLLSGKRNPSSGFIDKLVLATGQSSTWWLHGEQEYVGLMALDNLLDLLIANDMIVDADEIDETTMTMITAMVQKEIENKLKKKRKL